LILNIKSREEIENPEYSFEQYITIEWMLGWWSTCQLKKILSTNAKPSVDTFTISRSAIKYLF